MLSNPAKRADYDRQRQAQKNGSTSDYDEDEAGSVDLKDALEMMATDWRFALDYYPDLAQLEADLQRLSTKLGLAFKLVMLSDKQFDKRSQVAKGACKLNCVNAHRLQSHQKRKFYVRLVRNQ
ncbi:MAG: hypothetical protein KAZ85_01765 [Gammaproteobacteria bacterium]|nr:hypothetical protein [Gammaproteobacteria bacterium]